jgi:hypothetical protein
MLRDGDAAVPFCFNCKAGIADRMTPSGHDPLQLE